MSRRTGWTAGIGIVVAVSGAMAGPPLLCHPYDVEGRPVASEETPLEDVAGILAAESEALVRAETLRRLACREDRMEVLAVLAARLVDAGPSCPARWDHALYLLSIRQSGAPRDLPYREALDTLRGTARAWDGDAGAWLVLARATTPLMRGDEREHAAAFVRAWDLAHAMPEGPARGRVLATLDHDLGTLERYWLEERLKGQGIDGTPESLLTALRAAAGQG